MCYPCPRTPVTLDSGLYTPPRGAREKKEVRVRHAAAQRLTFAYKGARPLPHVASPYKGEVEERKFADLIALLVSPACSWYAGDHSKRAPSVVLGRIEVAGLS